MAAAEQRSLYRHFLRIIYAIAQPAPKRVSLIRLLRPQLRDLLQQRDVNLTEARATMDRTLDLLTSSPHLLKKISSLAYHHYPHHLPRTNNARRLVSQPPTFKWDPQAPEAALKAFQAEAKRREKDPAGGFGDKALAGLRACMRRAEKEHGVMLGRLEGSPRTG